MRINRFLAAAGLGSRRSCEDLIRGRTVTVNGQICQNLATEVGEEDFVKVGGRRILPEKHLYVVLHKPRGYLCTAADTHERKTIFDLLPRKWPRLFNVGRLDLDSEGLLILTNDGDLALRLTHPRFKIDKEYEVLLDRPFNSGADGPRLLRGVHIEGGHAVAEAVWPIAPKIIRVVLRQGLKRQIRQMLYKVGYEVERLIRTRIGPLRLNELRAGEWRALTAAEVKALSTGQPPASKVKEKELGSGRGRGGRATLAVGKEKDRPGRTEGRRGMRDGGRRSGGRGQAS
jgi:23S rRNA pseudouridine2605 synthase